MDSWTVVGLVVRGGGIVGQQYTLHRDRSVPDARPVALPQTAAAAAAPMLLCVDGLQVRLAFWALQPKGCAGWLR